MAKAALTCTHNLCFEQKYGKYQNFSTENFHFLQMKKICCILYGCVFVMSEYIEEKSIIKLYIARQAK